MMDVHPPHRAIENARDFFLQLLTITAGLLIAFGLEACVEWGHHRSLRREADANLHQELRDNQKDLAASRFAIAKERENLISILTFLSARIHNQPTAATGLSLSYTLRGMRDASWRTAADTGALGYMEYSHVQRYADAYQVQEEYVRLERETLDDFLQLQSYVITGFEPDKITPAEAETASEDVRHALSHLAAMDQFAQSLSRAYDEALAAH
jgi:hypothetical protein